tara:strand:+ start:204 stop:770 length:567 start_codon:yes stop_codon:yes gene_type:complete
MPSNSKLIAELMNNSSTISTSAIPNGSGVSIGSIVPFGGTAAPTGFLACDGSAISRTTYADLFSAISTTWGTGDGSSTFNIPDLRNEFVRGSSSNLSVGNAQSQSEYDRTVRFRQGDWNQTNNATIGRVLDMSNTNSNWGTHNQTFMVAGIQESKGMNGYRWRAETQGTGQKNEIRPRAKVTLYCIKF